MASSYCSMEGIDDDLTYNLLVGYHADDWLGYSNTYYDD